MTTTRGLFSKVRFKLKAATAGRLMELKPVLVRPLIKVLWLVRVTIVWKLFEENWSSPQRKKRCSEGEGKREKGRDEGNHGSSSQSGCDSFFKCMNFSYENCLRWAQKTKGNVCYFPMKSFRWVCKGASCLAAWCREKSNRLWASWQQDLSWTFLCFHVSSFLSTMTWTSRYLIKACWLLNKK